MLIIAPEKESWDYQGHQDSHSGDHEHICTTKIMALVFPNRAQKKNQ